MKFSAIIAAASAVMTVSALPTEKRQVGGILMCTGANATETCQYVVAPMNQCVDLKAPFLKNVTTFAPDGEPFGCYPKATPCSAICTSPEGCTPGLINYTYPHKFNLAAVDLNSEFASFECALDPAPSS